VLVAEDNVVNQKVIVTLLGNLGYRVILAANGAEALKAALEELPDLVLMDVQMPIMGGIEATRRLRAEEQGTGRRVPIVALTAHAMKSDEERCVAAGMDGYLTKPLSRARLAEVLKAHCPLPAAPERREERA